VQGEDRGLDGEREEEARPADPLAVLRRDVRTAGEAHGWTVADINDDYFVWSEGATIPEADADTLVKYVGHLRKLPAL